VAVSFTGRGNWILCWSSHWSIFSRIWVSKLILTEIKRNEKCWIYRRKKTNYIIRSVTAQTRRYAHLLVTMSVSNWLRFWKILISVMTSTCQYHILYTLIKYSTFKTKPYNLFSAILWSGQITFKEMMYALY
jgi:hypothetical protein